MFVSCVVRKYEPSNVTSAAELSKLQTKYEKLRASLLRWYVIHVRFHWNPQKSKFFVIVTTVIFVHTCSITFS